MWVLKTYAFCKGQTPQKPTIFIGFFGSPLELSYKKPGATVSPLIRMGMLRVWRLKRYNICQALFWLECSLGTLPTVRRRLRKRWKRRGPNLIGGERLALNCIFQPSDFNLKTFEIKAWVANGWSNNVHEPTLAHRYYAVPTQLNSKEENCCWKTST